MAKGLYEHQAPQEIPELVAPGPATGPYFRKVIEKLKADHRARGQVSNKYRKKRDKKDSRKTKRKILKVKKDLASDQDKLWETIHN